jgi:hypothetical protein
MALHTGVFLLMLHYQLILLLQCSLILQISTCSIMFQMPLNIFPHILSLDMLILTGPWIFATTTLSLASSSNLLVLLLPGNAKFNLLSLSALQKLNFLLLDAGKMALYLQSILDELHVKQIYATLLYEDNHGALLMAHAGQPTKQSHHIDIWHYALTDWVEHDLIALEDVASGLNAADAVTKQTGGILFAQHVDNITGRLPPPYVSSHSS